MGGQHKKRVKGMRLLEAVLQHNVSFVEDKGYEPYRTSKYPDKKMAVLSCMDTRLTELLPKAMNIRNGDAKIVKNAGAVITDPFDSVVRSLLVAVIELGAEEVFIVAHHGCGMAAIQPEKTLEKMVNRGVSADAVLTLQGAGVDLHQWLEGFESVEESVKKSVQMLRQHPLFPPDVPVHGLVIDPETGKLDLVVDGYKE